MTRLATLSGAAIEKEIAFYAYCIGGVMDLQWDIETMQDPALYDIVKGLLSFLCGKDEWKKLRILDAIRDQSRSQIRDNARHTLPSLFTTKAAWPLALPKEAQHAKFDIELIYKLKQKVEEIRRDPMEEQTNNTPTESKAPRLHLPAGITPDQLTADNFRSLVGRRFRVSVEQQNRINAGTLTREGAFAEFITQLKKENQS